MSTLSEYSQLLQTQVSTSKYPKLLYENNKNFNNSREVHLRKVLNNNVVCTGVINSTKYLFPESSSYNYYEFLQAFDDEVNKWKYYYVSEDDFLLIESLIPYVNKVDFKLGKIKKVYLDSTTLYKKQLRRPSIITKVYEDNNHPILSSFKYTGVVIVLNNNLIYEYYDSTETFDSASANYYSLIPPLNNRIELSIETKRSIYEQSESALPETIYIKNNNRKISFTGEMNNTLIKNIVLYKYIEIINGENFALFSTHKPFYGDKTLVNKSLGLNKEFKISTLNSKQVIKTKQKSLINIILNKQ